MASPGEDAYCTLLMTDGYLPGAVVLAHSLRDAGTSKKLAAMITPESLSTSTIDELKTVYDYIIPVQQLTNKTPANLYLMDRPDLHSTFTKINLWRQSQFRKIVYIDADVVALRAPDELFDVDVSFAAAPDIGWPDIFNTGVMLLTPNMGDYYALLALAQRGISFDGADQGLLNMHFKNYHRLSFRYNCTPSGNYQYVPAYRHFQSSISMVHYIGQNKPWTQGRHVSSTGPVYDELLGRWWEVYDMHYRYPTAARFSGQKQIGSQIVQQYVSGEEQLLGYSSVAPLPAPAHEETNAPPVPASPQEKPSHEAAEQVPFTAPMANWDPSRSAPPAGSQPEAGNFPNTTYEMSQDPNLFRAPSSYPGPPKNILYTVPDPRLAGERPKPIFPWESNQPKPTRVFDEDRVPSPPQSVSPPLSGTDDDQTEVTSPATSTADPGNAPEPWKMFVSVNAWDNMPEIDRYLSSVTQTRKQGQVQGNEEDTEETGLPRRRPSMKLTDFPTEVERPSLPVTPAPVRRPSFWGAERDDEGELPAAAGVPKQEDWDPTARLEQLTRHQAEVLPAILSGPGDHALSADSSAAGATTTTSPPHVIPNREQPDSAAPLPTSPPAAATHRSSSVSDHHPPLGNPNFVGGMRVVEEGSVAGPEAP